MKYRNPEYKSQVAGFYSLNRFDGPRSEIEQEMDHMSEQFTEIYNHFDNLNAEMASLASQQPQDSTEVVVTKELAEKWKFKGSPLYQKEAQDITY